MLMNPVAVEKVALHEFAEIASRQEALQTIFPSALDIFYHPIFDFFPKTRLFQQPLLLSPTKLRAGHKLLRAGGICRDLDVIAK
jgi:hypothetical protein